MLEVETNVLWDIDAEHQQRTSMLERRLADSPLGFDSVVVRVARRESLYMCPFARCSWNNVDIMLVKSHFLTKHIKEYSRVRLSI